MISYDLAEGRFNLRAAAVIIRDGDVLVHRAEQDDFWALPGGRVELFEATPDTLKREKNDRTVLSGERADQSELSRGDGIAPFPSRSLSLTFRNVGNTILTRT